MVTAVFLITKVWYNAKYDIMFHAHIYFHKSEHSAIINIFLIEPNENKYRTEFSGRKKGKEGCIIADETSFKNIKGKTWLLHSHGKQHLLLIILPINTFIQPFETVKVTFEVSICPSSVSVGKKSHSIDVAIYSTWYSTLFWLWNLAAAVLGWVQPAAFGRTYLYHVLV